MHLVDVYFPIFQNYFRYGHCKSSAANYVLGIVIEKSNSTGIIIHVSAKKGIRRKLKSLPLVVNSLFMILPLLLIVFPVSNSRNETAELLQHFGSP